MGLPLIPITLGLVKFKQTLNNMTKPICIVKFRTGPKKYAYRNPGFDIERGDFVIVPTASGNDLEAEVVTMSITNKWASKATREVISLVQ